MISNAIISTSSQGDLGREKTVSLTKAMLMDIAEMLRNRKDHFNYSLGCAITWLRSSDSSANPRR